MIINPLRHYDSKYEQIGCIGHGGFSSVFLAKTRNSERKVVLKVFRVQMDNVLSMTEQNHEPPEAFTREISVMKKLQENKDTSDTRDLSIVYFEKSFKVQNFACIVMNYCSGGTLAQQIESRSKGELYNGAPYSERRIAWYVLQIVEALAFMHNRGIYHSDVKSSNVLIDWESGGKIILADLGSAVGIDEDDEIFGFTKSYAPPELLVSHENDDYDGVDTAKVDAFGLGCILFELVCCKTLVDIIDEEDTTLADIITEKGLNAVVDEKCGKLPWLPTPDQEQKKDTNQSEEVMIGYSFALKSLLKSLLEPDPSCRWKPSELEKPLREDPSSPLLASVLTASHTPVPGDIVTMDNIQLGMFVQYGPDYGITVKDVFEVTSKIDGTTDSINFQSITAMDEYHEESFEEMRLMYYLQQASALAGNKGIIGVISKIDPDALYTGAMWPTNDASSSFECNCYRIGAGNSFELQVGPILCNDFFDEMNLPPRKTGLVSNNTLVSQFLNKVQCTQPIAPGLVINGNSMVVYNDLKSDYSLIAPLKKVTIPFQPRNLPICPTQEFIGPSLHTFPCPEYWNLECGEIVEEDCLHFKDAVTELFFSEHGGMNIQEYEILSVKRVQNEQLWTAYSKTMEDVAVEAWGVSNERYMFLGTGRHCPEELLQTDPENFFHRIVSNIRTKTVAAHLQGKIYFSDSSSHQHSYSFGDTNNERKLILSRVVLGRIKKHPPTSPLFENLSFHSVSEQLPDACLRISVYNPFQAYPEYIITYKSLPQPSINNPTTSGLNFQSSQQQQLFSPTSTSRNVLYQNIELPHSSSPFRNIQIFNRTPGPPSSSTDRSTPPHTLSSLFLQSLNEPSSTSLWNDSISSAAATTTAAATATMPTSSFGTMQRRAGTTTIPYVTTSKFDGTTNINFHSITAMAAYASKSFEELRMEDYYHNNTRTASSATIENDNDNDNDNDKKKESTTTTNNKTNTNISTNNDNHRSNTKKCVVCLEKDVLRILLPCGHPCLCEVCGTKQGLKKLKYKCPECRSVIQDTVIIYGRVVDD